MKKQIYYALFALLGILTLPHASRAQVKIGNNYTTIGNNSNLEVEATNGKKVIVNKADGSMVIETTPTSNLASDKLLAVDGTGKVVTVDRTTIISSGSATGSVGVAPFLRVEGNVSSSTSNPNNPLTATGLGTAFANLITYNSGNGAISIPSTGYYYYALSATGPADLGSGSTNNDVCVQLYRGTAQLDFNCGRSTRFASTAITAGFYRFTAGDVITVRFTTASNVVVTTGYAIKANIYKISD